MNKELREIFQIWVIILVLLGLFIWTHIDINKERREIRNRIDSLEAVIDSTNGN